MSGAETGMSAGGANAADTTDSPYRWYVLLILTLVYTCHYLDRSVVNAVLEPIRHEFNLSDASLGLLAGPAYAVAYAAAGLPLGLLIDRLNRKRLLASLVAIWSLLTFTSGLAESFGALLLARMAVGAAEAGGAPTAMAILSDYFPPQKRATATGVFFLSTTLGLFAGFGISGIVARVYGWRAAFFAAGLPGLSLALLLLLTIREPKRGQYDSLAPRNIAPVTLGRTFRTLAAQPALRNTLAGIIIAAAVLSGFLAFSISLLIRHYGFSLAQAGISIAVCSGLAGGAGSLAWGIIGDWLARKRAHFPALLVAWTTIVSALFAIAGVLANSSVVALACFAAFGFFSCSFMGSGYALLLDLSPVEIRGSCTAVSQVLINLIGAGFGPVVVGGLSTLIASFAGVDGLAPSLLFTVSLNLLSGLCHFAAAQAIRRDALASIGPCRVSFSVSN